MVENDSLNYIIEKANKYIANEKYREAFEVLSPYEDSEHIEILNNLAFLYMNGLYTRQDPQKALLLFERSLKLGSALAAHNIGTLYLLDLPGLPKDKEKAKSYYKKSIEMGANFASDPKFYEKI